MYWNLITGDDLDWQNNPYGPYKNLLFDALFYLEGRENLPYLDSKNRGQACIIQPEPGSGMYYCIIQPLDPFGQRRVASEPGSGMYYCIMQPGSGMYYQPGSGMYYCIIQPLEPVNRGQACIIGTGVITGVKPPEFQGQYN